MVLKKIKIGQKVLRQIVQICRIKKDKTFFWAKAFVTKEYRITVIWSKESSI